MNEPEALEFIGENEVRFHGRTLAYFSGCDYFRLARNPPRQAIGVITVIAGATRSRTTGAGVILRRQTELLSFA